jgi:hypothetical protein
MRRKHGRQQASILGHLEALGCFNVDESQETVFAEFGAGKGMIFEIGGELLVWINLKIVH